MRQGISYQGQVGAWKLERDVNERAHLIDLIGDMFWEEELRIRDIGHVIRLAFSYRETVSKYLSLDDSFEI